MADQTHVIDVRVGIGRLGDNAGLVPKAEAVGAGGGFGDGKKALAIPALHAGANDDLAVMLERAGIEDGVNTQAFEEEGVGLWVEIVAPLERHMGGGKDRAAVALINAVVPCGIKGVRGGDD